MLINSNKFMTLKTYQKIRLVVVFVLAAIFSQAIALKNYIIPIGAMIVAALFLIWLRRRVKDVIADERDYATGGKAALLAIQIYGWFASISMFVLYALRDINPAYEPIALTLAFSTCILMLIYGFIFRYFNNFQFSKKKWLFLVVASLFAIILTIGVLRTFSGEDNWICKDGAWQKHGQPSFQAPNTECK